MAVHEDTLSFHEDCFLCEYRSHAANKGGTGRRHRVTERICGAKLGGQPYYFVNKGGGGGPVGVGGVRCCQECYKREIAATCQKCAKKIIGKILPKSVVGYKIKSVGSIDPRGHFYFSDTFSQTTNSFEQKAVK